MEHLKTRLLHTVHNVYLLLNVIQHISSAAGASDLNARHRAPPVNVFDIKAQLVQSVSDGWLFKDAVHN